MPASSAGTPSTGTSKPAGTGHTRTHLDLLQARGLPALGALHAQHQALAHPHAALLAARQARLHAQVGAAGELALRQDVAAVRQARQRLWRPRLEAADALVHESHRVRLTLRGRARRL